MELYDVMHTTFAARDFTAEAVPDAVIYRILDHARFAPSGGNRQGWKVIVVRDPATREALGSLIAAPVQHYVAQVRAGEAPWNTVNASAVTQAQIAATPAPTAIVDKLIHAPVILLVFVDLAVVASFDRHLDRVGVISGASIYPFVWNILLAARNEGYGGTPTTFIGANEAQLQALLGVPAQMAFAAMIPLGRPVKQLKRLTRKPVETFAVLERWDGAPLQAGEDHTP
jgi:nitroreductase